MDDGTPSPKRRRGRFRLGKQVIDGAYGHADNVIDRAQHGTFRLLGVFLPNDSVIHAPKFQQVMASRFLSDAGQQALIYGGLISVVRGGGDAFEAALVGVAALIPPALLGLFGGAVADAIPKRVALALFYNLQAVLCFAIPFLGGTSLTDIMLLIFAVNVLGQVSGPTESAVLPFVATDEELASAVSLVGFASNLGTAFGTAILAPVLVRVFGVESVFYTAGILLFLAATRVFDLTTPQKRRPLDWRRPGANMKATVDWLIHERAVGTMMVVAVLAGTANIVLQTLAPRYVKSALGVDPADAVYVFGPSAIGLAVALVAAPPLIARFNERWVALSGFAVLSITLCLLGFLDTVKYAIDPFNPLRLLEIFGLSLSRDLRTAGVLAVFVGFGLSLTTSSVQTYMNRRVPLSFQGRAFALQSVLKNGSAIVPLLTLGAIASVVGVQTVLIFSPFVLLIMAVTLVRLSVALGGPPPTERFETLRTFLEESDEPVGTPDDIDATSSAVDAVDDAIDDDAPPAEADDDGEHQDA